MNISLIHLSDIHIKKGSQFVLQRANALASAISSVTINPDIIIVAVTGDIVFSGDQGEYELALQFFQSVRSRLMTLRKPAVVKWVFIAGNHDCNFHRVNQPRSVLIDALPKISMSINEDSIKVLTEPLNNFFDFQRSFLGSEYEETNKNIFFEKIFQISDKTIKIMCYNSALCSQREEKPGTLLIPLNAVKASREPCDIAITLLHHPYSWLIPENRKDFQRHLIELSDFILTGHEHDSMQYIMENIEGIKVDYIEGTSLHDLQTGMSGFNAILIDLTAETFDIFFYSWDKGLYRPVKQHGETRFERNKNLYQDKFRIRSEFRKELSDLGVEFTHRRKQTTLSLEDLFIYPNFNEWPITNVSPDKAKKSITGEEFLDCIATTNHLIITGEELSGKTVLAKRLYLDLRQSGLIPLLLHGRVLHGHSRDSFFKTAFAAFQEQYSPDFLEEYKQTEKKQRALIIDDYDKSTLNSAGRALAISHALDYFGKVIIIGGDLIQLEEFTSAHDTADILMTFRRFEIRQAGLLLKRKLIEKWIYLGAEFTIDLIKGDYDVDQIEKQVDVVLGDNFMPRYPFFIYTLLQLFEANTNLSSIPSSYGYLYESLLAQALSRTSSVITLDSKYKFLSIIAFDLFQNKARFISENKLRDLLSEYGRLYDINISFERMIQDLLDGRILRRSGEYRFNHPYLFYYFVARFIKENLQNRALEKQLRTRLDEMVENIHNEEFFNIILFYLYLTQDQTVIDKIVENARKILPNIIPCDLSEGIKAFSNLEIGDIAGPRYEDTDPAVNREKLLAKLDEIKPDEGSAEDQSRLEIEIQAQPSAINAAAKSLQIMGQVLRNFPGSILAEDKKALAREAYALGLRTLQFILDSIEASQVEVKKWISQEFEKKIRIDIESEKERFLNSLVFVFALLLSHVVIRKIASSVGMVQLKETFKNILADDASIANSFVDASIKLEFFPGMPESEIMALHERVKKNNFTNLLLKHMVLEHIYLYRTDHVVRQRLLANLEISQKNPKLLPHPAKKKKER